MECRSISILQQAMTAQHRCVQGPIAERSENSATCHFFLLLTVFFETAFCPRMCFLYILYRYLLFFFFTPPLWAQLLASLLCLVFFQLWWIKYGIVCSGPLDRNLEAGCVVTAQQGSLPLMKTPAHHPPLLFHPSFIFPLPSTSCNPLCVFSFHLLPCPSTPLLHLHPPGPSSTLSSVSNDFSACVLTTIVSSFFQYSIQIFILILYESCSS